MIVFADSSLGFLLGLTGARAPCALAAMVIAGLAVIQAGLYRRAMIGAHARAPRSPMSAVDS